MFQGKKEVAMRGGVLMQNGACVGKAQGGKVLAILATASVAMTAGAVQAAIAVPTELTDVFTDLGTAFGVIMAAGAVLFGVIRGGVALFKLVGRVFSAAGA